MEVRPFYPLLAQFCLPAQSAETETLVPYNTPFLLTTNSGLFSTSGPTTELSLTTVPSERYFDRPDVLKAYREQLIIQTPSFTNVQDNPSVGRFRPRGPEDVSTFASCFTLPRNSHPTRLRLMPQMLHMNVAIGNMKTLNEGSGYARRKS